MENQEKWNDRTSRLIGADAVHRLKNARVLVVGVGGVGGYAAEMLARAGIGYLAIVDADDVSVSNINRQLIALHSTVGQSKTDLLKKRFKDINPNMEVTSLHCYLTPENVDEIVNNNYDYVVDAIDTVAPKVALITYCLDKNISIISSMGAGGRLDPMKIEYADLWSTREDGLARVIRQRLKKSGHKRPLKVVYSSEVPRQNALIELNQDNKRTSFGTLAPIPSIFGIYLANHVIREIAEV